MSSQQVQDMTPVGGERTRKTQNNNVEALSFGWYSLLYTVYFLLQEEGPLQGQTTRKIMQEPASILEDHDGPQPRYKHPDPHSPKP